MRAGLSRDDSRPEPPPSPLLSVALMSGYLATPEKSLIDLLYLSNTRSRLFASLPELELPDTFRFDEVQRWQSSIRSQMKRTVVGNRLRRLIDSPVLQDTTLGLEHPA